MRSAMCLEADVSTWARSERGSGTEKRVVLRSRAAANKERPFLEAPFESNERKVRERFT